MDIGETIVCYVVALSPNRAMGHYGWARVVNSVAVVAGCHPDGATDVWILSRTPELPADVPLQYIMAKLAHEGVVVDRDALLPTAHSEDCAYY
jgi:lipocalin